MDLDNIIYIVVTIVLFIVSILGKTKKKEEPVPIIEDEEEYNLNEFEKLLMRKQEFADAIQGREDEEEQDEDDFAKEENERKEKLERKMETMSKKNEKSANDSETNEEYEDGFDVKSAIIYSSILERKNFRH